MKVIQNECGNAAYESEVHFYKIAQINLFNWPLNKGREKSQTLKLNILLSIVCREAKLCYIC